MRTGVSALQPSSSDVIQPCSSVKSGGPPPQFSPSFWLIHFRAALLRPGYDEPWLVEQFDQLVLNGLAPAERDLWRIEPEQQDWVTLIDPHPDFVFTLEIMRLEGLGGTVIAATEWGDIEEARLALYNKTLETIRSTNSLALDMPPRSGD